MKLLITPRDLDQIKKRGSDLDTVEKQFSHYETGFPNLDLDRPATLQDGILQIEKEAIDSFIKNYDDLLQDKKVIKFVPASGAASRMFSELLQHLDDHSEARQEAALNFLAKLKNFAFYPDLEMIMDNNGYILQDEVEKGNYKLIIEFLLENWGLNYRNMPKGLLQFHRYPGYVRLAVEEHLVEAALYAKSNNGVCYLHFTVAPEHLDLFKKTLSHVVDIYEERFNLKYEIGFSVQDSTTDTLAATPLNQPFRDENGELFFRPGGHGALLANLGRLDCDLIFVKNIDNVAMEDKIEPTVTYKKVLAAILLKTQKKIFDYLHKMDQGISSEEKKEVVGFLSHTFGKKITENIDNEKLRNLLHRPLRVCGMVKNEGEPGGGPFWVKDAEGDVSLQIVETIQINQDDPKQKAILNASTHFNPVDMVCSIKDYHGNSFHLQEFVDGNTGLISEKMYAGRPLKAMELPGLWNGAMAGWNTIFVEVPLETFNPVKTIEDLLRI